jgi:hypothetical protein
MLREESEVERSERRKDEQVKMRKGNYSMFSYRYHRLDQSSLDPPSDPSNQPTDHGSNEAHRLGPRPALLRLRILVRHLRPRLSSIPRLYAQTLRPSERVLVRRRAFILRGGVGDDDVPVRTRPVGGLGAVAQRRRGGLVLG